MRKEIINGFESWKAYDNNNILVYYKDSNGLKISINN